MMPQQTAAQGRETGRPEVWQRCPKPPVQSPERTRKCSSRPPQDTPPPPAAGLPFPNRLPPQIPLLRAARVRLASVVSGLLDSLGANLSSTHSPRDCSAIPSQHCSETPDALPDRDAHNQLSSSTVGVVPAQRLPTRFPSRKAALQSPCQKAIGTEDCSYATHTPYDAHRLTVSSMSLEISPILELQPVATGVCAHRLHKKPVAATSADAFKPHAPIPYSRAASRLHRTHPAG